MFSPCTVCSDNYINVKLNELILLPHIVRSVSEI